MGAVDPTYPLYPIACVFASTGVLLVLMTSVVRQKWNLGVAFLCFWLFVENLAGTVNTIVWSDDADVKLYVYCDIVSHIGVVTAVVKPVATLLITRRLYLIASLQTVEIPSGAARRWDLFFEWTLGLAVPLIVAGPLYYINQFAQFNILAGFGCSSAADNALLYYLTTQSWSIITPLLSILIYYPKVARIFYRQNKEVNHFLNSNSSVSRTNYHRIIALASIDILLTLPIGIANTVINLTLDADQGDIQFYPGWHLVHSNMRPEGVSRDYMKAIGTASLASLYFAIWTSPILAFATFGLFGLTPEACASYWRIICTIGGCFGWKLTPRAGHAKLYGTAKSGVHVQASMTLDAELGSHPSFIDTTLIPADRSAIAHGNASTGEHTVL